jgi:hypothetical protein
MCEKGAGVMMRKIIASLIVSFLLFDPAGVFATDIHSFSRTYLRFRETANGDNLVPLYEYLDLNVENIEGKGVSFFAGGWGRVDLADESFTGRTAGDLQYAYLSFWGMPGDNTIDFGRFYIMEGVASEQIDGIALNTRLQKGFAFSVYGGIPVETDFDNRGSDYIFGGRVSYENRGENGALFRVGVSALKEDNDSNDFREEEGIDVWIRPVDKIEVQGRSFYNSISSGWMEHTYYVTAKPIEKLHITGDVSYVDYGNYFQSPTLSVFTPFFQNPDETVLTIGFGGEYTLSNRFSAGVDYKNFEYDLMGSADLYGGKLTYSGPKSLGGGLSLHRMDGETDELAYYQFRIYGIKDFGKLDFTVDIFDVNYDEAIQGEDNAFSISVAGGYNINEKARIGADFEYSENPNFDEDLRIFIKFLYQFGEIPWGA